MRRDWSRLLLIVILATVACGADGDRQIEQGDSELVVEPKSPNSALRQQRAERDLTIWKDETTAQEFGSTFIRLWDDLRNTEDTVAVLSAFPFSKLTLGVAGTTEELDHGITQWSNAAGTRELAPGDWQELLEDYRQSGWELVQSEWHHTRFAPSETGPKQSEFGIVLHAQNSAEQRRVNLARSRSRERRGSYGMVLGNSGA